VGGRAALKTLSISEVYGTGGETVYVCSRHLNGVTEAQYKVILGGSTDACLSQRRDQRPATWNKC
jgi:hypothetical protein